MFEHRLDEETRKFRDAIDVGAFENCHRGSTNFIRRITSTQFKESYELINNNSTEIARNGVGIVRGSLEDIRNYISRTNRFVEELIARLNEILNLPVLDESGFRKLFFVLERAKQITEELKLGMSALKRNSLKNLASFHEKIESINSALKSLKEGDNPISDGVFENSVEGLSRQLKNLIESLEKIIKTSTIIWREVRRRFTRLNKDYIEMTRAVKAGHPEERQKLIEEIRKTINLLRQLKERYGIVDNI